ncbi:MAG TPA: MntP/YtaF family protein [Paenibacillus sp.]|uniref:MntP/YtaF family protein n=1 Tax=Paenibacillus sp. TaxID=58172 RepID=UPI0028D31D08|nr:MntP/YtaF family protein [Paenibacillus sp.]HUC93427.1 MntP/YtaF family protein [Paenibacillus sp.]
MLVHLLSLLLLAFAVSLDGFGVGVTYGLRHIRIPVFSIAIIAVCSGTVIGLSMLAGEWLTAWLSPIAARTIGAVILIAIGCMALYQILRGRDGRGEAVPQRAAAGAGSGGHTDGRTGAAPFGPPPSGRSAGIGSSAAAVATLMKIELKRFGLVIQILRTPQAADVDRSGVISPSEALLLGAALSLDSLGAGLGAAMLGFSPLLTAVFIAASSGLFLLIGMRVGLRTADWRGMRAMSALPGLILIIMGITRLL